MSQTDAAGRTAQERSTGDLVKLVGEQVSVLVRDELKLAQLEMTGKAKQAGQGMGMMGGGALIALYGLACLIACVIIAVAGLAPGPAGAAPYRREKWRRYRP